MTDPMGATTASLSQEDRELVERPKWIRTFPLPWYVTMDGIKTESGIWVCETRDPKLAHDLVALANFADTAADRIAVLLALLRALATKGDGE